MIRYGNKAIGRNNAKLIRLIDETRQKTVFIWTAVGLETVLSFKKFNTWEDNIIHIYVTDSCTFKTQTEIFSQKNAFEMFLRYELRQIKSMTME